MSNKFETEKREAIEEMSNNFEKEKQEAIQEYRLKMKKNGGNV